MFCVQSLALVAPGRRSDAYYAHTAGRTYRPTAQKEQQQTEVKDLFIEHKRRYGSRRILRALKAKGEIIGRDAVRKALADSGLCAIQRQRPTAT